MNEIKEVNYICKNCGKTDTRYTTEDDVQYCYYCGSLLTEIKEDE